MTLFFLVLNIKRYLKEEKYFNETNSLINSLKLSYGIEGKKYAIIGTHLDELSRKGQEAVKRTFIDKINGKNVPDVVSDFFTRPYEFFNLTQEQEKLKGFVYKLLNE